MAPYILYLGPLVLPADEDALALGVDALAARPPHHLLVRQRVHQTVLVESAIWFPSSH